MTKKTAVEWLDEQLQDKMYVQYGYGTGIRKIVIPIEEYIYFKQQAKAMEKEQMHKCGSFWRGKEHEIEKPIFEQYYNETYNKS